MQSGRAVKLLDDSDETRWLVAADGVEGYVPPACLLTTGGSGVCCVLTVLSFCRLVVAGWCIRCANLSNFVLRPQRGGWAAAVADPPAPAPADAEVAEKPDGNGHDDDDDDDDEDGEDKL